MDGFVDVTLMLRPAVYLLWFGGKVVYVGQTICPLTRIYAHRNAWMKRFGKFATKRKVIEFDKVSIFPTDRRRLDVIEQKWIKFYRPEHNVKHNKVPLASIFNLPPKPTVSIERRI